jgi:pimeloyl-ACP methyl ester carboxylesterase
MRRGTVLCLGRNAFHNMRYYDWGDASNPRVVLCVHGITRSGRDFDVLARALAGEFRVICPDMAGRGESDWLASKGDYAYPQYMSDLTTLIAHVAGEPASSVYWVGTSMGGLIGMIMAALPRTPIARLVLNDAGMIVPKAALERLALYVGKDWRFPGYDELEAHMRWACAPFGPLTDEQWRHLTIHTAKKHDDGSWGLSYDPAIGDALQGELADIDLSRYWEAIVCPTLLLRGAESDVLTAETAAEMTARGPKARLVEFPGIGHAPMLMSDDQIAAVREFLLDGAG